MTESDNIRQMRKMNFLNKTANKSKITITKIKLIYLEL